MRAPPTSDRSPQRRRAGRPPSRFRFSFLDAYRPTQILSEAWSGTRGRARLAYNPGFVELIAGEGAERGNCEVQRRERSPPRFGTESSFVCCSRSSLVLGASFLVRSWSLVQGRTKNHARSSLHYAPQRSRRAPRFTGVQKARLTRVSRTTSHRPNVTAPTPSSCPTGSPCGRRSRSCQ